MNLRNDAPVPCRRLIASAFATFVAATLVGCGSMPATTEPARKPFELNIAHLNDHHSNLEGFSTATLVLDGVPTQVELGGFARQAAFFNSLSATPNLLKLHAGDASTGTLYYTLFKGRADARMMNSLCFDAFVPGNHEFDDGDAALKALIDALADPANGGACGTPTVAANIVPQPGTPLARNGASELKPYVVKRVDGVDVGIVGIVAAAATRESSRPLATTEFLDEVASAQKAIDALRAQGVRHVVLLTHVGYAQDRALAAQLTDVDVIIGGHSHTPLGDFSAIGVTPAGPYPTLAKNKSGETVCIGQAWEYGKAYGLMHVRFDDRGRVTQCGGESKLLIGDGFRRKDAKGAWVPLADGDRQALAAKLASSPGVRVVPPDPVALQDLSAYSSQVATQKAVPLGVANEALCMVRVPGEATNRSAGVAGCEKANTLARGSDAAEVIAEAFLQASRRADFALQNAGGVRAPITAGTISMNTAFTVLPFNNTLVELELTGAQLVAAFEDAVAEYLDRGGSDGSHPYAAGLRWDLDLGKPKGQRFTHVEARDRGSGTWKPLDPARRYVLITNDFVAAGQDGYATLGEIYRKGTYVNTYLLYTQTFVDYVLAQRSLARPPLADYSHQRVVAKDGRVLP